MIIVIKIIKLCFGSIQHLRKIDPLFSILSQTFYNHNLYNLNVILTMSEFPNVRTFELTSQRSNYPCV